MKLYAWCVSLFAWNDKINEFSVLFIFSFRYKAKEPHGPDLIVIIDEVEVTTQKHFSTFLGIFTKKY